VAGDFKQAFARVPVLQPNQVVSQMIRWFEAGKSLGVIIPIPSQEQAAKEKWGALNYRAVTYSIPMTAERVDPEFSKWLEANKENFQTLLFDCTGYPLTLINEVRKLASCKVFSTDELLTTAIQAYTSTGSRQLDKYSNE
jgi:hypothetical protein